MAMPMKRSNLNDFIILALDFDNWETAKKNVKKLGDKGRFYKVGMRLFFLKGMDAVYWLQDQGKKVFLDLKLNDIPITIKEAVRTLSKSQVELLTVFGDQNAVMAASEAVKGTGTKIVNVTVLTSEKDSTDTSNTVFSRTEMSVRAGAAGVVCSGWETEMLRKKIGKDFLIINPGIRPPSALKDDQKRVISPVQALDRGASHIVIGRPVFKSANPVLALEAIENSLLE